MTSDLQPEFIQGAYPGIQYEAHPGRKTAKSTTFIGRVHVHEPGGGMELWHCDHKHRDETEAQACAKAWAEDYAARERAKRHDPAGDVQAMRDSIARNIGLPVEFEASPNE